MSIPILSSWPWTDDTVIKEGPHGYPSVAGGPRGGTWEGESGGQVGRTMQVKMRSTYGWGGKPHVRAGT